MVESSRRVKKIWESIYHKGERVKTTYYMEWCDDHAKYMECYCTKTIPIFCSHFQSGALVRVDLASDKFSFWELGDEMIKHTDHYGIARHMMQFCIEDKKYSITTPVREFEFPLDRCVVEYINGKSHKSTTFLKNSKRITQHSRECV